MSGAAIGGFGVGLAQGLRLGTDIVDSAAKREMMGKQAKLADIEIAEKQGDLDLKTNIKNYMLEIGAKVPTPPNQAQQAPAATGNPNPAPAAAIAMPTDQGEGAVPQTSGAGIATPTEGAALPAATGKPATAIAVPSAPKRLMSDNKAYDAENLNHQREVASNINAMRVASGKMTPYEAATQSLEFDKLMFGKAFRLAQQFIGNGKSQDFINGLNKLGYDVPEGSSASVTKTAAYPGADPTNNVILKTADGRTIDMQSMLMGSLDLKDIATFNQTAAYQSANIKLQQATLAASERNNAATLKLKQDELNDKKNPNSPQNLYLAQLTAASKTLQELQAYTKDAAIEDAKKKTADRLFNTQLSTFSELYGVNQKTSESALAKWSPEGTEPNPTALANFTARRMDVANAMIAASLNKNPDGSYRFDPSEIFKALGDTKGLPTPVYDKNANLWKTQLNGKDFFVKQGANDPNFDWKGSGPAASTQAPAAGIKLPPGLSSDVSSRVSDVAATAAANKTVIDGLKAEAAGLTPVVIKALTPDEAMKMLTQYEKVLSSQQRSALLERAKLAPRLFR